MKPAADKPGTPPQTGQCAAGAVVIDEQLRPGSGFNRHPAPVIETVALTKRYGPVTAVDSLDLRVGAGEICALLGPNGAGKTTTILMLLGLTEATSGSARVLGYDPSEKPLEIKRQVGYLPENLGFYGDLTAFENLSFVAALNGLKGRAADRAVGDSLEAVGLSYAAERKAAAFSRGMRQRLGLAEVLVKDPKIMILDEPTLGLDPDGIDEILRLIASLAEDRGLSIMISSHLLPLVERVAHRAVILKKGRLVASGTLDELAAAVPQLGSCAAEAGPAELRASLGSDSPLTRIYRHYFQADEAAPSTRPETPLGSRGGGSGPGSEPGGEDGR